MSKDNDDKKADKYQSNVSQWIEDIKVSIEKQLDNLRKCFTFDKEILVRHIENLKQENKKLKNEIEQLKQEYNKRLDDIEERLHVYESHYFNDVTKEQRKLNSSKVEDVNLIKEYKKLKEQIAKVSSTFIKDSNIGNLDAKGMQELRAKVCSYICKSVLGDTATSDSDEILLGKIIVPQEDNMDVSVLKSIITTHNIIVKSRDLLDKMKKTDPPSYFDFVSEEIQFVESKHEISEVAPRGIEKEGIPIICVVFPAVKIKGKQNYIAKAEVLTPFE